MHEYALCRGLLRQLRGVARRHRASRVSALTLQLGPLAGVDAALLRHAFAELSAGGLAEGAGVYIRSAPLRVRCRGCGGDSAATVQRLRCPRCGSPHTELLQGEELMLIDVELSTEEDRSDV